MTEEDINPMEGAINIVDAMLVFACGLMLSLVIYWNVDLRSDGMIPVSQAQAGMQNEVGSGVGTVDEAKSGDFEEVGKVYRDPTTGNLYMSEASTAAEGTDGKE
jgi:hypothetical protein